MSVKCWIIFLHFTEKRYHKRLNAEGDIRIQVYYVYYGQTHNTRDRPSTQNFIRMLPHAHQNGMHRFITLIIRLSEDSREVSQAGPKMA